MNLRSLSNVRRVGVLFCALAVVIPLGGSAADLPPGVETAKPANPLSCPGSGPISAASLASGVSTSRCALVGRVVVSGDVSVAVPPAGGGVAASGVGTPSSPGTSLRVTNVKGVVTATSESSTSAGTAAKQGPILQTQLAGSSPPCRDGAFRQQGHDWKISLRWGYHQASTPRRMKASNAVEQIRLGLSNIRDGQDNCGLNGRPDASSRYLGRMTAKPNIFMRDGRVRCGTYNSRNTVGWGPLPGNLLGYTCYWWNRDNKNMIAADMRLDPGSRTVLRYPANCRNKFDLQSLATHEWGHAYGLLHPGAGHAKLTMAHLLPPCSKAPRTLGLGDWRGMRKLYGLR